MVQAIRDQWVIALAIVVVVGVVVWLVVDRWSAGGWRRGR